MRTPEQKPCQYCCDREPDECRQHKYRLHNCLYCKGTCLVPVETLQEFSDRQEFEVRSSGNVLRGGRKVLQWNAAKVEQIARLRLANNPYLKGVSLDELLNEADFPGSFSNK